jgi:hypothetical protein
MSTSTKNTLDSTALLVSAPKLEDLEFVANFQSFPHQKTGKAIARWLIKSHKDVGLLPDYVMHHSTDGAANAVLSAQEYEEMTRKMCSAEITFSTCSAHQCHRAALWASGDISFKGKDQNPELNEALEKLHQIVERIRRSAARTKILDNVQKRHNR